MQFNMEQYSPQLHEEAKQLARRLKRYWTGMLLLPLLYLMTCLGIDKHWFEKRNMDGFFPLTRDGAIAFWVFLGIVAIAGAFLVYYLQERFGQWLDDAADAPAEFFRLLLRRLLVLGAICDTVSFCGLMYFLFDADIRPMAVMGAFSYVLYARIYPHESILKKLRGLPAAKGNGKGP
jgi:hypothetical protein